MVTRSRVVVLVLLVLIVVIAAWSKLRYLKEGDFEPQRIRLDEYPAFQKNNEGG